MRIKMGTSVPKMGTTVHLDADQTAYRTGLADALRRDLGWTWPNARRVPTQGV